MLLGLQSIHPSALESIGDALLSWIPDPDVELVVVMIFAPMIMNMIQFWVQDNFLKAKTPQEATPGSEREVPVSEQPKFDPRDINNVVLDMPPYTGPQIEMKA